MIILQSLCDWDARFEDYTKGIGGRSCVLRVYYVYDGIYILIVLSLRNKEDMDARAILCLKHRKQQTFMI